MEPYYRSLIVTSLLNLALTPLSHIFMIWLINFIPSVVITALYITPVLENRYQFTSPLLRHPLTLQICVQKSGLKVHYPPSKTSPHHHRHILWTNHIPSSNLSKAALTCFVGTVFSICLILSLIFIPQFLKLLLQHSQYTLFTC